jgi:ubiquinone/menaquinone biosynthesis C-methylase UbiE
MEIALQSFSVFSVPSVPNSLCCTMLDRILEPEVMDSTDDAREYDAMDHAVVNAQFVTDLLPNLNCSPLEILDLGAGTAQIPIEIARRALYAHITAVDAASSMLAVARANIAAARLSNRIEPILADAKHLLFAEHTFPAVISNSVLHHIAEPQKVIAEAVRVTAQGGLLFHRDLARPSDEVELQHLVHTYAGSATTYQRKLFSDSLRAALTLEEVREIVERLDFGGDTVQMTSDRHWTWTATRKM